MSDDTGTNQHPAHGQLGYLQLPAIELAATASFYREVFGWSVDAERGGFEAPALIGQFTTDLAAADGGGPMLWLCVDRLDDSLARVTAAGGQVDGDPVLDNGERWLAEIRDVSGNRLGIVAPVED